MPTNDMERAVESLAHQIAGQVHSALAYRHMTTTELKQRLQEIDTRHDLVDKLLAAEASNMIGVDLLADISFVLNLNWRLNMEAATQQKELEEDNAGQ